MGDPISNQPIIPQQALDAPCELMVFQAGHFLGQLSFNDTLFHADEQQAKLAQLTQLCQTPKLQLVMIIDARQAGQGLLDLQFALMQHVYRPLMRNKGAQVWVIWQHSNEAIWREGALALCQIMALELAPKQVAVNFLHQSQGVSMQQLTPLLTWSSGHYCTAQALALSPINAAEL